MWPQRPAHTITLQNSPGHGHAPLLYCPGSPESVATSSVRLYKSEGNKGETPSPQISRLEGGTELLGLVRPRLSVGTHACWEQQDTWQQQLRYWSGGQILIPTSEN